MGSRADEGRLTWDRGRPARPSMRPRPRIKSGAAVPRRQIIRIDERFAGTAVMNMARKLVAEFLGTGWLVLGGCGSAVLAAAVPNFGIGYAGVALAFGLTVLTGAYAFGHISGAHFNPAGTLGLAVARRFPLHDVLAYWIVQVAGAIVGAAILYAIANGAAGFDPTAGFASNGYGEHSPQGYSLLACLICEAVMTFMFVIVILGATSPKAPLGFAPLAIGLALTLIHLISIPVTNTSVNP